MRLSFIFNALGLVLRCIAIVILAPILVALIYKDYASINPFVVASLISLLLGIWFRKRSDTFDGLNDIKKSEALLVVAVSWVMFGVISAIPYLFYGLSPINALFEAVSGITTTGATILTTFDYPKAMMFWRSMSQWLGGMGIIVLFIAILPQFAVAGRQMFFAEAPGPTEDKMTPRIRHTATALWAVYVCLTAAEIIALYFAGMPLFDAFCNSFSTLAAGGFSPNPLSISGYNSSLITWIVSFFMLLAGANFALQYKMFFKFDFKSIIKNEEMRLYLSIVFTASLIIAAILFLNDKYSFLDSLKDSVFQVLSLITTTGFASVDFTKWSISAKMFLFLTMFIGGCAGSAAGGIKVVRVLFVYKYLKREISKILHPNAIYQLKINNGIIPKDVTKQMIAFVIFYLAIYAISVFLVTIIEHSSTIGVTGSIATLGNIGPGFGIIGPMGTFDILHPATKTIFIITMLVGRLELIPFLAMLHPDFWIIKDK